MAILTLNAGTGSPVDVPVESFVRPPPVVIGEASRAVNGNYRDGVRGLKILYSFQTSELTSAQFLAIVAAIGNFNIIPCNGDALFGTTSNYRCSFGQMDAGTIAIPVGGYKFNMKLQITLELQ